MKIKLYLIAFLSLLQGCASNGYLEPSTGATAQFSFESVYKGEVSKIIKISPFAFIYEDANSCGESQRFKGADRTIKLTAGSLVTMNAGFSVHYTNLNRATFKRGLFSFVPKEGGSYKLLIDYDNALSSVVLKLVNIDSGKVEPIRQRKLIQRANLSLSGFCDQDNQGSEYSDVIYGKNTILNPISTYEYSGNLNDDFATVETTIKQFELLGAGISTNPLLVYKDPENCSSFTKLKSGLKNKFRTDKEIILFDIRKQVGTHCSTLFAFQPESGKSYEIKGSGQFLRNCSIEVIDTVSQEPVDLYRKKIDRTTDIPKCVDLHDDDNKKKYKKTIIYSYR